MSRKFQRNNGRRIAERQAETGETGRMLADILEIVTDKPCMTQEDYENHAMRYFQHCIDADVKPTVEGFALGCGFKNKNEFERARKGLAGEWMQEFVERGCYIIQAFMAAAATNGMLEPSIWIFYGKNYFGYKDDKQLQIEHNVTVNMKDYNSLEATEIMNALPMEEVEVIGESTQKPLSLGYLEAKKDVVEVKDAETETEQFFPFGEDH